uniref:Integrase zinc-binding domain-containing protein n=1 Tax=Romanomermis culicivorax TaxID=13658 RepID=A0A915I8Q0_ROMCU
MTLIALVANAKANARRPARTDETRNMQQGYFWPQTRKFMGEYCQTCQKCQSSKPTRHAIKADLVPVWTSQPFE